MNKRILCALYLILIFIVQGCSSVYEDVDIGAANTCTPVATIHTQEQGDEDSASSESKEVSKTKHITASESIAPVKKEAQIKETPPPPAQTMEPSSDHTLTCTLSVTCQDLLQNLEEFNKEKTDIVPNNGIILAPVEVVFEEGESVFDVLLREMKKNKIHMDFVNAPMYNSVYIKAIANIYEFDFGGRSGWLYEVNGEYPNCGSSAYIIKDGDVIRFLYTCE